MLRTFLFCLSVSCFAVAWAETTQNFTYEKNTFLMYRGCIGVHKGTSLKVGEKVWWFSNNEAPKLVTIANVIDAKKASTQLDALRLEKIYSNELLFEKFGCVHEFSGDFDSTYWSYARVTPKPSEDIYAGLVIRGLPANAWLSKSIGKSVAMSHKNNPYLEIVKNHLPDKCYASDSLVRIRKLAINKERTIVQLDVGKAKNLSPTARAKKLEEEMQTRKASLYDWAWVEQKDQIQRDLEKKRFFQSVEICRFFLDGDRMLSKEKISRSVDINEATDVNTELDFDNWATQYNNVVAFISLDEGVNWDAVYVSLGFESSGSSLKRLNSSHIYFDRGMYTYH